MQPVQYLFGSLLIAALVTAGAVAVACQSSFDPQVFAVTGLVLQLAGLLTVAYGLGRVRRDFGIEGDFEMVWKKLRQLLGSKPPVGPDTTSGRLGGTLPDVRGDLKGTVGATFEQRVAALEERAARLGDALRDVSSKLNSQAAAQQAALAEERSQREQQDQALQNTLKETATGGLHIETAGLVWLMFGIIYATVPDWLSSQLKAMCGA